MSKPRIRLGKLKPGSFFKYGETLGFKSEYKTDSGAIEAFCVKSGEMFWGGTNNPNDQRELLVSKVELIEKQ